MPRENTSTWVKLHRKIADNPVMRHPIALQVLVWCLVKVQRLPYRHSTRWGAIDLLPGEVMTARRELADKLGTSERKIRTALELLSKERIISVKTTNTHSIIKLTNWASHQDRPEETTSTRPALDQHSTQEQEREKDKKKTPSIEGKAFTDYFYDKHLKAHNQKPSPAVWTFKKSQDLTSALGLKEICRRCDNYFADPYLKAHPLEKFLASPDTWIEKRALINTSKVDSQVQRDRKQTAI